MGTITFRDDVQAALWDMEITGQLSDGHWENSRPYDHWKVWCNAKVAVDPADVGRDFWAQKDNYALCSKDLLDVIGERMEAYGRLTIYFGRTKAKLLESCLDLNGDFRGPPDYQDHGTSTYYADLRKQLEAYDMDEVKRVAEDDKLFNRKMLLKALRDMKIAMKRRKPGA